jgi:fumarylpyruvate hydrolase
MKGPKPMTMTHDPRPQPTLPVIGDARVFPVGRIFCVGRNYAAHAAEMGNTVDREAPWYFTKSAAHLIQSDVMLPYPPGTVDLHHEIELVVAIGAPAWRVDAAGAMAAVFGYATGLDMTRRDLQAAAKEGRRPWDTAKDFEGAAVIGPITPVDAVPDIAGARLNLRVNDAPRQDAALSDMVWSVPAIISHLSGLYHLGPGDIIMTGTPAGVGAVVPGDVLEGGITGLAPVRLTIGAPDDQHG